MAGQKKSVGPNAAKVPETPDTLQEALRAMSMRAAVDAIEFSNRMKSIRDRFDGTVLASDGGSAVSAEQRKQPGEVVYEAVRMQLEIANELMSFGQRQADFWLDRFQRMATSALPREQRPRLRLSATVSPRETAYWKLFLYNAAHESREVRVTGRWRALKDEAWEVLDKGTWLPEPKKTLIAPRAEKELIIGHVASGLLEQPGEYVAKASVRMRGAPGSTAPSLVVGRLELALTVRK